MTSCYLRKKKAGRFKTEDLTENSRDLVPSRQHAWGGDLFSSEKDIPKHPKGKGSQVGGVSQSLAACWDYFAILPGRRPYVVERKCT